MYDQRKAENEGGKSGWGYLVAYPGKYLYTGPKCFGKDGDEIRRCGWGIRNWV